MCCVIPGLARSTQCLLPPPACSLSRTTSATIAPPCSAVKCSLAWQLTKSAHHRHTSRVLAFWTGTRGRGPDAGRPGLRLRLLASCPRGPATATYASRRRFSRPILSAATGEFAACCTPHHSAQYTSRSAQRAPTATPRPRFRGPPAPPTFPSLRGWQREAKARPRPCQHGTLRRLWRARRPANRSSSITRAATVATTHAKIRCSAPAARAASARRAPRR
jgi:hypothetical protein